MNLLVDESVDRQIADRLRRDGHDVKYITEIAPGTSDDIILRRANLDGALLITADKDFGKLAFRQKLLHAGVLLVRFLQW
jgi:predicted nuclease of predicted toxin-antitoxin system